MLKQYLKDYMCDKGMTVPTVGSDEYKYAVQRFIPFLVLDTGESYITPSMFLQWFRTTYNVVMSERELAAQLGEMGKQKNILRSGEERKYSRVWCVKLGEENVFI